MTLADLDPPIFVALTGNAPIAAMLPTYDTAKTVFTRRPVPGDVPFPMIISAGDVTRSDEDDINLSRPIIIRDVSVFGLNDTAAHYRAVVQLGLMVRDLFHGRTGALVVPGWHVIRIVATGPIVGPTDDDTTVHRLVTLNVRLSPAS